MIYEHKEADGTTTLRNYAGIEVNPDGTPKTKKAEVKAEDAEAKAKADAEAKAKADAEAKAKATADAVAAAVIK
jgi:membrane protein involved in colicin uptake